MPFITTKVLVTDCRSVNYDTDGQTIGQLVDAALVEMVSKIEGPSIPQSIEFGFDGPEDFDRFMSVYGPVLSQTIDEARRSKKARRADYNPSVGV